MTAALAAEAPTFSPQTLSVFAQLLGTYNLNAASETFEQEAQAIAGARRELAAAIQAAGMVPQAQGAPMTATAELDGDELEAGLRLVDEPNRAARRAAAKPKGATRKR